MAPGCSGFPTVERRAVWDPRRLRLSSRRGELSGEWAVVAPAQQGVTELRRPQGSLPGSGCRALARTGLLVTLEGVAGGPTPLSLKGRPWGPKGWAGGHQEAPRSC